MSSYGLQKHQSCKWFTDTYARKTPMHIKKNYKKHFIFSILLLQKRQSRAESARGWPSVIKPATGRCHACLSNGQGKWAVWSQERGGLGWAMGQNQGGRELRFLTLLQGQQQHLHWYFWFSKLLHTHCQISGFPFPSHFTVGEMETREHRYTDARAQPSTSPSLSLTGTTILHPTQRSREAWPRGPGTQEVQSRRAGSGYVKVRWKGGLRVSGHN